MSLRRVCLFAFVLGLGTRCAAAQDNEPMRIEVRTLTRLSAGKTAASEANCADWILTVDDVKHFFAHARLLTGEEWHSSYDVFSCAYAGRMEVDGQEYEFGINAGSFGTIAGVPGKRVLLYGCDKACKRMFGPQ